MDSRIVKMIDFFNIATNEKGKPPMRDQPYATQLALPSVFNTHTSSLSLQTPN
jgi:hypothetical protein